MKKILSSLVLLAATSLALASPLQVSLQALKVAENASGHESLVVADTAAPGDIIVYQAVYTNTSAEPLQAVKPEIPIPAGLTVIEGSATPEAIEVSLDGKTFAALPLLDAEGNPLPLSQLRSFRWLVPALSPSESITVSIRATVDAR